MKKQPKIQPFRVPEHVFVDMHNGQDFVPVPLSQLDRDEVYDLVYRFIEGVAAASGHTVDYDASISDKNIFYAEVLL